MARPSLLSRDAADADGLARIVLPQDRDLAAFVGDGLGERAGIDHVAAEVDIPVNRSHAGERAFRGQLFDLKLEMFLFHSRSSLTAS
jgi:hypothetical protein